MSEPAAARRAIYVYEGRGSGEFTRACAWLGLERELGGLFRIESLDAERLNRGDGLPEAALLVFPGGADRPYVEDIDARGVEAIRGLVERGDAVLGICAGAYYLCERIDFEFASGERVRATRPVRLFEGEARGPLRDLAAAYDEHSAHSAAVVALRDAQGRELRALYWGGPHFAPAPPRAPAASLALDAWLRYADGQRIAALSVARGAGRAVLCGVHAEVGAREARIGFSAFTAQREHVGALVRALGEAEASRAALWARLIDETGCAARAYAARARGEFGKRCRHRVLSASTMEDARSWLGELGAERGALAAAAELHGACALAGRQTQGRGTLGRQWESSTPEGVWFTLLLDKQRIAPRLQPLSLALGVALCRALREFGVDARPKWVNDALVGTRKIAGILVEECGEALLVGIGINVNQAQMQGEAERVGTSLRLETGREHELGEVWARVLLAIEAVLAGEVGAVELMRADWRMQGQRVRVLDERPREAVEARVRGLDEHGNLELERADGTRETLRSATGLRLVLEA